MPENNNKKGSKIANKLPEQKVSIKVKGQGAEQAAINQGNLNKKEPQGKEKGRSGGGLLKGIVNFIKGIFTATIDMPEQFGSREKSSDRQKSEIQGQWISLEINQTIEQKNPEDLSQETKQKVEKAGEGLKEVVKRGNGSDRPVEGIVPNQIPGEAKQEKSDGKQIG